MMLAELMAILDRVPDSDPETVQISVILDSLLGKPTGTARRLALSRLNALYGILKPRPIQIAALRLCAKADRVFLDMLALFETQGRDISPNPSKTYAPTVFAELPEADGLGSKTLQVTMNRLLKAGRIRIEKHGPESRPRSRLIVAPLKDDNS